MRSKRRAGEEEEEEGEGLRKETDERGGEQTEKHDEVSRGDGSDG